jgi:WD40 repeat protein
MKFASESLAGTVFITTLVAAGVWYGQDSEDRPLASSFLSAGSDGAQADFAAVNQIAWSADGKMLLARFYCANAGGIRLELLDSEQAMSPIPIDVPGETASTAALAPDSSHVLLGTYQGRLWWIQPMNPGTATLLDELPNRTFVTAVAISGDGRLAGAGTSSGLIYLYDLVQTTSIILTTSSTSAVRDLHFSHDGLKLIGGQSNGHASFWKTATGELLQEIAGQGEASRAADFLPDGLRSISAGLDDTVRIWDIVSGRELWRGEFGLYGITTLAVSPDGKSAAWGGYNRKVIVWDLELSRKKFEIVTSAAPILHLQFSPDGSALAAAGVEGVIRLYDMQTAAEKSAIEVVSPTRL